jgi:hypothetical protein
MAWPYTTSIDETKLDNEADSIKTARAEIYDTATAVKSMIDFDTAPAINNLGTVTTNQSLDIDDYSVFKMTIGADLQISFTGTLTSGRMQQGVIFITNGGAHTVTYGSEVKFTDGTAPTLTASGTDMLTWINDGGSDVYVLFAARNLS